MESQSLPRSLNLRHQERQSGRSSRSPNCLTRCESRQFKQLCKQLWRSRGQWNAPPTAPPLGVSRTWTWETSLTSTLTRSSFSHLLIGIPGNISHPTSLSHLLILDLLPVATPSSPDLVCHSAHPQITICSVGSLLVFRSPAPLAMSLKDPSTPPSASDAQTPPQSCDPTAPPQLPAPSSPPEPVSPYF